MPASLVHMLVSHKAIKRLGESNNKSEAAFADTLNDVGKGNKSYANLGSIGPDLYYFKTLKKQVANETWKKVKKLFKKVTGKKIAEEKLLTPAEVVPFSHHLHSAEPNKFVLNLMEVVFKDVKRTNGQANIEETDYKKLAYVAGHLTHIAADQIIHPLVNRVAGPYYVCEANREKHQECEVYQDYYVYRELYKDKDQREEKYDFFSQEYHKWVDGVRKGKFESTWKWFRHFLQRGFSETYGIFPNEDEIEDSVDNLLLVLRFCKDVGPYAEAKEDYEAGGEKFRIYVEDTHYMEYFEEAIELSVVYLRALYKVYDTLGKGESFTAPEKKNFLNVVSEADLSCPLEKDILKNAAEALESSKKSRQGVKI